MKATRTFASTPDTVAEARQFVESQLDDTAATTTSAIVLMVSELASNSVRHAQTGYVVDVERADGSVKVTVTDDGGGEPGARSPLPTETSGRGLQIVANLSDDWGIVRVDGSGKQVWFTLRAEASFAGAGREAGRATTSDARHPGTEPIETVVPPGHEAPPGGARLESGANSTHPSFVAAS